MNHFICPDTHLAVHTDIGTCGNGNGITRFTLAINGVELIQCDITGKCNISGSYHSSAADH